MPARWPQRFANANDCCSCSTTASTSSTRLEHITDELAVCPNVSILATFAPNLETDDEHVMRLDTLRDSVRASELFVREGRRRSPDIAVSVEDLEVIREICDRLDGIPLAIELAAARTQSLDVQTILARLSDLIATPRRRTRADHGHQTMSDVVDWSTNLLDPDVASGLGALTVFPGDFDLDAAEAVLATATTTAAAEIVDELVAHSMLEVVRGGRVRYRLLGPVRQRVSETLLRDESLARDTHLEHFLDRLESAYEQLGSTSSSPFLAMLDVEFDNLRSAHEWARESNRVGDDVRFYRPLAFARWHGQFEPGRWAVEALATPGIEQHKGWGAVIAVAAYSAYTQLDRSLRDRIRDLTAEVSDDDTASDMVSTAQVDWVRYVDGDWGKAAAMSELVPLDDVYVRFHHYWMNTSQRAPGTVAETEPTISSPNTLDLLDEGLAWARSVGAKNIEAALLQRRGYCTLRNDPSTTGTQAAIVMLTDAEALAAAMQMGLIEFYSSLNLLDAHLLGGTLSGSALGRLIRLLRMGVSTSDALGTAYALARAARFLADLGHQDLAVMCTLPGGRTTSSCQGQRSTQSRNTCGSTHRNGHKPPRCSISRASLPKPWTKPTR